MSTNDTPQMTAQPNPHGTYVNSATGEHYTVHAGNESHAVPLGFTPAVLVEYIPAPAAEQPPQGAPS